MTQNERFDICNDSMENIGTATRWEVHNRGLWHQTFQCWIISLTEGSLKIMLQLRQIDKDTFPGKLDISCAGHLLAGESREDGIRELEEELGLQVPYEQLAYAGVVAEEYVNPPVLTDREFCHVHVYECDMPLTEYKVQTSELAGLFWADAADFRQLVYGLRTNMQVVGMLVEADGTVVYPVSRTVTKEDLTPNSKPYYDLLFSKIDDIMAGNEPIASNTVKKDRNVPMSAE